MDEVVPWEPKAYSIGVQSSPKQGMNRMENLKSPEPPMEAQRLQASGRADQLVP